MNNQELSTKNQEHSTQSNDEVLVKVENVSKKFCRDLKKSLWYGVCDIASELLPVGQRSELRVAGSGTSGQHATCYALPATEAGLRPDEFYAVRDVSFELRRGECLGLIGRNGAGKTTLLKMLNGLIKPDSGRIEMRGRIGALIALGAGFNPILTGRENVYVNGSVLGLTKKEIDAKFDEIVDFAEIEEFIDSPVRSYSSGMQVRLGFAVASTLDPDVLIIDEVLAVGDAGYRSKCYERINLLKRKASIIFVSHNMVQISRLCKRSLLLDRGVSMIDDITSKSIAEYEKLNSSSDQRGTRFGNGHVQIQMHKIKRHDKETTTLHFGSPADFEFKINKKNNDVTAIVIDIAFKSLSGEPIAECSNYMGREPFFLTGENETWDINCHIKSIELNPGVYSISYYVMDADMGIHFDWIENAQQIEVQSEKLGVCDVQFNGQWSLCAVEN